MQNKNIKQKTNANDEVTLWKKLVKLYDKNFIQKSSYLKLIYIEK